MLAQIRKDLRDEFTFSTDSGILIDNDTVYKARYNDQDQFQVWINGTWENIEGIDFDCVL